MTKTELIDMMQSDMKLWDNAQTKEGPGGVIEKVIDLSAFGLDKEWTVRMEGITNAEQRREAVAIFGSHVRAAIKEKIDDEAVTARAAAQAAYSRGSADRLADSVGTDRTGSKEIFGPSAVPTSYEAADFHTELTDRAEFLRGRIAEYDRQSRAWRKELMAVEAALRAYDASEIQRETGQDSEGEGS